MSQVETTTDEVTRETTDDGESAATATLSWTWPVAGEEWTYTTEAPLTKVDDEWQVAWSRELIDEGESLLRRASDLGRPLGRFQLEAAIQAVHCDRARTGVLDVAALEKLYRGLVALAPTVGAQAALDAVLARRAG